MSILPLESWTRKFYKIEHYYGAPVDLYAWIMYLFAYSIEVVDSAARCASVIELFASPPAKLTAQNIRVVCVVYSACQLDFC